MKQTRNRNVKSYKSNHVKPEFETVYSERQWAMCGSKNGAWKYEKEALAHVNPDHFVKAYKCEYCKKYHIAKNKIHN